jgi:Domain of unknown function (DUF222)
VVFPIGLVLLGATVVVDGDHGRAGFPGGGDVVRVDSLVMGRVGVCRLWPRSGGWWGWVVHRARVVHRFEYVFDRPGVGSYRCVMSQSPFAPGQPVLFTAFDVVGEALDTAGDCALFGLTDTETVEGLRQASRTIARMEAVGLRLVSEVVGRDLARRCGVTSVPVFLRDRVHWSPREAARRVRLARTLNDDALVEVAEALRRGDVTLEQSSET